MPVFTVGNETAYDSGIVKLGRDFQKTGRRHDYPGGFAVSSVEDALKLIEEFDRSGIWAVYELDADWDADTVPSENGWWHALVNDSTVIRKAFPTNESHE